MLRPLAAIATVAVLALGTAARGDDDEQSSASAAPAPKPAAQIERLSGQKTEVTFDGGFVDALGTLQLSRRRSATA